MSLGLPRKPHQKFYSNDQYLKRLPTCYESGEEFDESPSSRPWEEQQARPSFAGQQQTSADAAFHPRSRLDSRNFSSFPVAKADCHPNSPLARAYFESKSGQGLVAPPQRQLQPPPGRFDVPQRVEPPPGKFDVNKRLQGWSVEALPSAPEAPEGHEVPPTGLSLTAADQNTSPPPGLPQPFRGNYQYPDARFKKQYNSNTSCNNNMNGNDLYWDMDMWSSSTVATYQEQMDDAFFYEHSVKQADDNLLHGLQPKFVEMIGNGTHAEVFLALWRNPKDGNTLPIRVVVKMFHPGFGAFNRGAHVLALEHKNLVKSFMATPNESAQSFTMEYCNEGSLQDLLARDKPLSMIQCLKILHDVAKGMEHLHENGVIHGDLKSSNILVTSDTKGSSQEANYTGKVSDYAFQRIRRSPGPNMYREERYGSQSWRYQAPEVFLGDPSEKSDIFSFAMVMYEVFMRQVPFFDIAPPQVPGDHLIGGRRPVAEAMIHNSSVLMVGVTKRCWDQDPQRRPSFGEVSRFLQNQMNLCCMYEFVKGPAK